MQTLADIRRTFTASGIALGMGISAAIGCGLAFSWTATPVQASTTIDADAAIQDGQRGRDGQDGEGAHGQDGKDGEHAADLPDADQILATYVKAIGGEERIKEVKSIKQKGTIEIRGFGVKGTFTLQAATPERMHMAMNLEGMGSIETGFDGTVGWRMDPNMGPVLLNDEEIAQVRIEADPQSPLHMTKHYPKRKTVKRTEYEATDAWELLLETKAGQEVTMYFGVENGLLLGQRGWQDTQMGRIETAVVFDDYRDIEGWKMSTTMTMTQGGVPMVMRIEDVEFNTVDDDAFKVPDPIKRLVEVRDREKSDNEHPKSDHPNSEHPNND